MSGLFEAIAMDDSHRVTASRKAVALAAKRVNERFAKFLLAAEDMNDLNERMALVNDDLQGIVTATCEESGYDEPARITAAIKRSFLDGILQGAGNMLHGIGGMIGQGGAGLTNPAGGLSNLINTGGGAGQPMGIGAQNIPGAGAQTPPGAGAQNIPNAHPGQQPGGLQNLGNPANLVFGSVHESRKPKLCPYHKEVVDVSLASGDPRAGYEAMSSHAWGPMHCDGEFEGSCSFRREMTTQNFWDERQKAIDERREERERQRVQEEAEMQAEQDAQELEDAQEPSEAPVAEGDTETTPESESGSEGLSEAPSAPEGVEAEVPMAVAASLSRYAPLAELDRYFDGKPGAAARTKVAMIQEHGIERGNEVFQTILAGRIEKLAPGKKHLPGASPKENRQYEHIKQRYLDDGKSEEEAKELAARTVNKQKKSDATKTIDVQQRSGPSPKMDKREWTEENLTQRVQTEGENSRWPTHDDDILETARPKNNDIRHQESLEQVGEATTTRESPLKETPPNRADANKRMWPTGETTAVSSVIDRLPSPTASLVKTALSAQDFRLLADAIRTAPIDEGARQGVAQHFAQYLGQTNPMFDADRFTAAALGNYNTQRDVFKGQVPGQAAPGAPEDPSQGMQPGMQPMAGTTQDVFKGNPLIEYLEHGDEERNPFVSSERVAAAMAKHQTGN